MRLAHLLGNGCLFSIKVFVFLYKNFEFSNVSRAIHAPGQATRDTWFSHYFLYIYLKFRRLLFGPTHLLPLNKSSKLERIRKNPFLLKCLILYSVNRAIQAGKLRRTQRQAFLKI